MSYIIDPDGQLTNTEKTEESTTITTEGSGEMLSGVFSGRMRMCSTRPAKTLPVNMSEFDAEMRAVYGDSYKEDFRKVDQANWIETEEEETPKPRDLHVKIGKSVPHPSAYNEYKVIEYDPVIEDIIQRTKIHFDFLEYATHHFMAEMWGGDANQSQVFVSAAKDIAEKYSKQRK